MQYQEDRRIGMVEADRADRVEVAQVVLVRRVVAVPPDDVERRMADRRTPQVALELGNQFELAFRFLVRRVRREEVSRVGQAIGADRTEVGQAQDRAEVLAHVAARLTIRQFDAEADAAWDHRDFVRLDIEYTELGGDMQAALLRHDQEFAVGVVEEAVLHRLVRRVQVDADAALRAGRTVAGHGEQPVDEIDRRPRQRQRAPAQLVGRDRTVAEVVVEVRMQVRRERAMHRRRADAVQPAAMIGMARRGERGTAHLLRVQPVRDALRRIASDRQRAGDRLGREFVAETGLVAVTCDRHRRWSLSPRIEGYSTPRFIWSRSMLSNSAWKLPSPKPSLPLRWMISKKIGPIAFWVKICSSLRCLVSASASIRILFFARRATSSPWLGTRWSITSKYVSGVSRNSTPCARIASTVA